MGRRGSCRLETARRPPKITTPRNLIPFAISRNRGPYYHISASPILPVTRRWRSDDMEPLLDTGAAAGWLTARGVRRAPSTLRKLRCIGSGPRYRVLNGKPYYIEPDLIAWIEERLSAPLRNSSERAAVSPVGARK